MDFADELFRPLVRKIGDHRLRLLTCQGDEIESPLLYTRASGLQSRGYFSPAVTISWGVLREVAPLPPAMIKPSSFSLPFRPCLSAPHTVVVTPEECQSKPRTQPRDWSQYGSA